MPETKTRSERRTRGDQTASESKSKQSEEAGVTRWHLGPFWLALASGLLLFAAFPPIGFWPLAWLAPVFWVRLILQPKLHGKRAYLSIWLAGMIYWLALFYFIPIPFWGLYFGWVAMSAYLGVYLPLFIGLTRVAVHRLRISVILAAPITWVGLELARGHLFSGLSMSLLGHTQVHWVHVIQIADLAGAYTISFAVMLVAACIGKTFCTNNRRFTLWPAIPAAAVVGGSLLYGAWRLNQATADDAAPSVRVGLIQGSIDTVFELTAEEARQRQMDVFAEYTDLTAQALDRHPDIDLIVWPESKFTIADVVRNNNDSPPYNVPSDPGAESNREQVQRMAQVAMGNTQVKTTDAYFLAGTQTIHQGPSTTAPFNAALLINSDGVIEGRYFKMHRVPFGEYVPLGKLFPWLYDLTPMSGELAAGTQPRAFTVNGLNFSPSICFESTVPHVIRGQMRQLEKEGIRTDFLVNITDDGWFKGTACLDHHLVCSTMRAVELRTPMLIAANTGFSGFIDGNGRVLEKGPRRDTAFLVAEVKPDARSSIYQHLGDWPAFACLVFSACLALLGILRRPRRRTS